MRRVFVVLVLLVMVLPVVAQDDPAVALCDQARWDEALAGWTDLLENVDTGDDDAVIGLVLAMQMYVEGIRLDCMTTRLDHETHPNGVIGPIFFNAGIYQVTWETADIGLLETFEVTGDCGRRTPDMSSWDNEPSSMTDVWQFESDCSLLIDLGVEAPWAVEIQRLR